MSKKLLIIPALAVTTMVGAVSVRSVAAQTDSNAQSSIIQKLVAKFGLNEAEVKAVFDADRAEREDTREKRFTDQLDQAVKAGKLTAAQKQLILNKRSELKSKWETEMANKKDPSTLTKADRLAKKNARKAEMDALKTWAKQNGIDLKYLMMGKGFGHGLRGPNSPGM